jgi:PAS domain S-box-containing protein
MAAGNKKPEEKNTDTPGIEQTLRDDAEKQFAHSPESSLNLTGKTPEKLIHELGVHQIELEMQAEQLRVAQLALEESRDKYLDLYEFAPLGYLTLTNKALITEVNLSGAALLGVERSRLVNHGLGRFIAPKDQEVWDQYFIKVQQHGEKQTCTLTLKRGDGSMFPARLEGIRITGSDGTITVRVAVSDITDIWQIEALKESEKQFRQLFESASDAVFVIAMDTTRIIDANSMASALYGYDHDQLLTMKSTELSAEPEATQRAAHEAQKEPGRVLTIPLRLHRKRDGTVFPVEITARNIARGKQPVLLVACRDITERKRAEEALALASRKLKLLSGITRHDITNQLTVQGGYLEILEDTPLDPTTNEYFQKVNTATKRIAAMIQFTKEYEQIGVNAPVWQECRTLVDTAAKQAPLGKVMVKNDLPTGAEVFADPLVVKVFYNLMDNAARYGGKITTIRFSSLESGDDHLIVCEDDGNGVPADEKEQIFERGFGKNTGLGLALAREILDITGITITETGEPGKGARFEIAVPNGAWRMVGNGE